MYAVTVTFTLEPDAMARFLPLMLENAANSLRSEPGCLQFDVCADAGTPDEVFLYELYTDRAAFDLHLAAPHFVALDAAVQTLVRSKQVRTFSDVTQ